MSVSQLQYELEVTKKIDFLSSIIHTLLSQIDILQVIRTLLNSALCVLKKKSREAFTLQSRLFDYEL